MLRKCCAALLALTLAFGALFAEEVRGTFVKFAGGVLTIKVDDKEKEFKVPADLKVKRKIKGEEKEVTVADILGKAKEGAQVTVIVEGDKVTDVKLKRAK